MGTHEELSNLLNGPSLEDTWPHMDVDGAYIHDGQWLSSAMQSRPPFDAPVKHQLGHYGDISFAATSPYPTAVNASHSYPYDASPQGTNVIGRLDAFGQNFLPPNPLDAVPEAHPLSESPMMGSLARLPFQATFLRGIDLETLGMPSHESDSANSSLDTNFQLTDNLIPQMECEKLPTMMMCSVGSLPQMKPPILPKLRPSGSLLLCPSQIVDGSTWDIRPIGTVLGRSLSETKREDRLATQRSHSTSTISSSTLHSSRCSILCNSNLGTLNKHPKKPIIGKLTPEERQLKIMRYRQKRSKRVFDRGVTYQCRKTLADRRPRVRGRFARSNDIHATYPNTTQATPQVMDADDCLMEGDVCRMPQNHRSIRHWR